MKTYEETFVAVLKRRDAYQSEKKNQTRRAVRIAVPAVCALAVIAAAGAWFSLPKTVPAAEDPTPKRQSTGSESPAAAQTRRSGEAVPSTVTAPTPDGAETQASETAAAPSAVPVPDSQDRQSGGAVPSGSDVPSPFAATSVPPVTQTPDAANPSTSTQAADEGAFASQGAYVCIPRLPQDRTITVTAEQITDEEAAAYFAENYGSIKSALAASGALTELRISEKGYSHVTYTGAEGESLELRANFRDYLAYDGDRLAAIITLFKENGVIYNSPAFGSPWFAGYDAFLQAHRGEALVYVYAGNAEIILLPDGGIYSPLAGLPQAYMEGIDNPYAVFYHPGAVYVP